MEKDVFNSIPVPKVGRNSFNLSHSRQFDCDAGQIIPFLFMPFIPGDHIKIGNNIVVRPQPMAVPVMSQTDVYTYYFAVSNRIMLGEMVKDSENLDRWEIHDREWEKFISGGESGNDDSIKIPVWKPQNVNVVNDNFDGANSSDINVTVKDGGVYSLWDYFGFPIDVYPEDDDSCPLSFTKRAYNLVYNWYFRDKNLQPSEVDLDSDIVQNCCWKKDYFTSALPWTQRGTPIALPVNISGTLNHTFQVQNAVGYDSDNATGLMLNKGINGDVTNSSIIRLGRSDDTQATYGALSLPGHDTSSLNATTFDINDLRLAVRVQQWLERNAITGVDYSEFILAHFGVAPRDDRLQKPLFLGSTKNPLWVSEVIQTSASSEDGTPQGNLSGHGLTAGSNFVCRYSAKEFGYIIGVMVIKPKAVYSQGIPRYLTYSNRFEYPFPEFMRLGEQEIKRSEICLTPDFNLDEDGNPIIFGYTGRFNELRYMPNTIAGGLRKNLSVWSWSRNFDMYNPPLLNNDFVKMRPDKNIFLVQDEPSFICSVGNIIQAWRPMPKYPTPEVI